MTTDDEGVFSENESVYSEDEHDYECNSESESEILTSDFLEKLTVQKTCKVLQEADIRKLQEDEVDRLSSTLSLSKDDVVKLLYHYRWNDSLLLDEWFADEKRVRDKVCLLNCPTNSRYSEETVTCGICFDSFPFDDHHFYPTVCGHNYCVTCWKAYLSISINDGPGCLSLRCPEPKCPYIVMDQGMIDKMASYEERKKYTRYLIQSYVEENKKMKWCPAPGCGNAVELEIGSDVYVVTCNCSYTFCWNCAEEPHRPVDCDTVVKWLLKSSSEYTHNFSYLKDTKSCPKCKRAIEKNKGCMVMECRCKFRFCWVCLGDLSTHHSCNIFKPFKTTEEYEKEIEEQKKANADADKYEFYYARWKANHNSRQKAIGDLHKMQTTELDKLCDRLKDTDFMVNAWEQIIECRRVLKWTYAYGYYLSENEVAKKTLFEYLQGEAEAGLERLHQCAEHDLSDYLYLNGGMKAGYQEEAYFRAMSEEDQKHLIAKREKVEADFRAFRQKLTDLTVVTGSYFENLLQALENDLSEVKVVARKKRPKNRFRFSSFY